MTIEDRLDVLGAVPDTPALVLDLGTLEGNVARMAALARSHGKALRPHAKTHKMPEVARMQLAAGAVGLQVAKLGEAEVFADAGCTDLFVGYPIVGAAKLDRLLDLAGRARISVSLDSLEVAEPLGSAARERGLEIAVLIEVNTGLDRVGVMPAQAIDLALRVADVPGIAFTGLLTHEGHAHARAATTDELQSLSRTATDVMVSLAAELREQGLACPVVSVGSTPTVQTSVRADGVTEVRPGTYVFNDATQLRHGVASPDEVAVWVVATVVSRPDPDRAVVDAGSKVLSSDRVVAGDARVSFGHLASAPDHELVRLSEEHGVIATPPGSRLRIGDRVAIVPAHICPTVNLADTVLVARGARLEDEWIVAARGRSR
jgi:D-serine deaminase-like pyridoxal phosphate-dependent protein